MAQPPDAARDGDGAALPITWRVGRAGLIACQIGVAAAAITVLGLLTWVLLWPGADPVAAGIVAAMAVILALALWRTGLYPSLVAAEDGLVIRNPLATVTLRWPDIVEVIPAFDGVTVTSVTAPPTTAWAVQKSNLSTWRRSHTRADAVATTIWELAAQRGAVAHTEGDVRRIPRRGVEPIDAARLPLPFPWRMSRPEAAVIGFMRHSSSRVGAAGAAALFGALGLLNGWFAGTDLWDVHLLAERGVVVEATVVSVPGLLGVTWPQVQPRTLFLETPVKDAATAYTVGQVVEVRSDPDHPTRARLVSGSGTSRGGPWRSRWAGSSSPAATSSGGAGSSSSGAAPRPHRRAATGRDGRTASRPRGGRIRAPALT